MRRMITRVAIAVLTLVALPAALLPATTYASAPAARHWGPGAGSQWSVTGTLVATPQSTLPATLFIQVDNNTIPVNITSSTRVEDASGNALSPSSMVDGDTLRVSGPEDQSGQIDARLVQDTSQSSGTTGASYQVTGTLAAVYTGSDLLCLANTSVVSGSINSNDVTSSSCPSGDLAVYYSESTSFENASSTTITVGMLAPGDSLSVTGTLSSGQFTATLAQDTTQTTSTTYNYEVTGTVAAVYTGSYVICLANASVVSGSIGSNALTNTLCPSDDLAVYYTSGTTFESASGIAITIGTLATGDSLTVTGTVTSSQFTATLVQDTTQTSTTTYNYEVTGTVEAVDTGSYVICLANASVVSGSITTNALTNTLCPSDDLAVYYTSGTTFENASGTAITVGTLANGDSLTVTGTVTSSQFTATIAQDTTQSSATAYAYEAIGALADVYTGSDVLCLASPSVVSGSTSPTSLTDTACPSGDLAVYYTGSTTFENASGTAITIGTLATGDSLTVTGIVSGNVLTASLVQDTTQTTSTAYNYQVTGTLALVYTSSNLLCLANASVVSGSIGANALTSTACPTDDLAVFFASSSAFENASGTAIGVGTLVSGDSLSVSGTISNSQFTAALVQDATRSGTTSSSTSDTAQYTLVGTVQSLNFSGRNRSVTFRVLQGSMRGLYTVTLPANAQVLTHTNGKSRFTAIRRGQTLTITGTFNRRSHRWMVIARVQIH